MTDVTLREIALEELALADGDRTEAVRAMVRRLLDDEELRTALIDPLIRAICNDQVAEAVRARRGQVPKGRGAR